MKFTLVFLVLYAPILFGFTYNVSNIAISDRVPKCNGIGRDCALATVYEPPMGREGRSNKEYYAYVRFILFNNLTKTEKIESGIDISQVKPYKEYWVDGSPVKVLIHGFRQDAYDYSIQRLTNEWIELGYNVILVDWGKYADPPWTEVTVIEKYDRAASHVIYIAQIVARFLHRIISSELTKTEDIHLVGYSLGAHLAGRTGYLSIVRFNRTMPRITGLDPAGPYFYIDMPPEYRLDCSDAAFVDVIHTDMGHVNLFHSDTWGVGFGFGTRVFSGHIDFFPNGGQYQPGCRYTIPWKKSCSHGKSIEFYTETVRNRTKYMAAQCKNGKHIGNNSISYDWGQDCLLKHGTIYMGEHINISAIHGDYFLRTENTNVEHGSSNSISSEEEYENGWD